MGPTKQAVPISTEKSAQEAMHLTGSEKVVATAEAEVGYLEKRTNAMLDDKTANAGAGNFNKYARDLDAIGTIFNGRKNGYDWCAVFVTWCYVHTFGAEMAQKLLCQPRKSMAAGVRFAANYFKQKGQFHTVGPQPGDQIFYYGSDTSIWQHTGLVEKVANGRVYTIEGNTSKASGVIPNGGGVAQKNYPLSYGRIAGYGRPDWSLVDGATAGTGTAVLYHAKVEIAGELNCRTSPVDGSVVKQYPSGSVVTISREKDGWGYTGEGWVSLEFLQKIMDQLPKPAPAPVVPDAQKGAGHDTVQPVPIEAERVATGHASFFEKDLAGEYTVIAADGLHVRNEGNIESESMVYLPVGTRVQCYGFYALTNGVKWLYIQVTYEGVKYTGFSSSEFLRKQQG